MTQAYYYYNCALINNVSFRIIQNMFTPVQAAMKTSDSDSHGWKKYHSNTLY